MSSLATGKEKEGGSSQVVQSNGSSATHFLDIMVQYGELGLSYMYHAVSSDKRYESFAFF